MSSLLNIGSTLVATRRALGMTQGELGGRIGVPQQQVARWEARRYANVALERVSQVADALGIEWSATESLALSMGVAEARAAYGDRQTPGDRFRDSSAVPPVRDLGEIVARIRAHGEELRERFGVTGLAAYGSFVSGRQTPESDVDLLVSAEDPLRLETRALREWLESRVLARRVDIAQREDLRWEIRNDVLQEALDVWRA